jgi:hypothetical protein
MGLLGRKRDARRKEGRVPELTPVPAMADLPKAKLQSPARYLGTFTDDGEKVVGQSLSVQSSSRLNLSPEALDVVRMAGSFRIPAAALRGAATAGEFGGKQVESLLLVRWEHGEQQWRTGFRMDINKFIKSGPSAPDVDQWVRTISKMARKAGEN